MTTPTYDWPTPADGDPVREGSAAIRALGNAIDAGLAAGGGVGTHLATALQLARRDAGGRLRAAAPSDGADVATKLYVDQAVEAAGSGPTGTGTIVGTTVAPGGSYTGAHLIDPAVNKIAMWIWNPGSTNVTQLLLTRGDNSKRFGVTIGGSGAIRRAADADFATHSWQSLSNRTGVTNPRFDADGYFRFTAHNDSTFGDGSARTLAYHWEAL